MLGESIRNKDVVCLGDSREKVELTKLRTGLRERSGQRGSYCLRGRSNGMRLRDREGVGENEVSKRFGKNRRSGSRLTGQGSYCEQRAVRAKLGRPDQGERTY